MKLNNMHAIISAHLSTQGERTNYIRTMGIKGLLEASGLTFEPAKGMFQGVEEDSFVVQCKDFQEVGVVFGLAEVYQQESVLLLDSRNRAFLLGTDKSLTSLGYMYQSENKPEGDYTYLNGTYYYCHN